MKLTNIATWLFAFYTFFYIVQPSFAEGPDLAKLDINAIKSIQLSSDESNYIAEVVVLLENSSKNDIKFKNADFSIAFKNEDQNQTIPFGNSLVEELEVPAMKDEEGTIGQTEFSLTMIIGPKDHNTVNTILKLFNLVGNPSHSLLMEMNGTSKVAVKSKHGWITTNQIEAELEFKPSIKREILFD
jgi:hypothetical protein